MNWKSTVSNYFSFTRRDRAGIITLLFLIILMYGLAYLAPTNPISPVVLDDSLQIWVDTTQRVQAAAYRTPRINEEFDFTPAPSSREPAFENKPLFDFDPNTLNAEGWMRLGLRERVAKTIINYRNKGGRFYKKEDLQKIWGLPSGFYERVALHILIKKDYKEAIDINDHINKKQSNNITYTILDINTADTSAWKELPGIGSKLAGRIVTFRTKLGGFISVDQVANTFGLQENTFRQIKPFLQLNSNQITKIKINSATKEELSSHPYINWQLAKAIVSYRQQHGPFKNREDFKQVMLLDEKTLEQLLPYLQFE